MKTFIFSTIFASLSVGFLCSTLKAEQSSEFDENAIRTIQDGTTEFQNVKPIFQAFEALSDPTSKAAKWEELITTVTSGLLASSWQEPAGGWRLVEFPATGNLTLEDLRRKEWQKAFYTKLIAKNEIEAVRLRGAQGLILNAASEGKQWAEKLILDIASRPDSNLKRLTYWSASNFGQDANVISWSVDWSAWQKAYNSANSLGKAIILKNITILAIRKSEFAVAESINLSALSGTDRELKAIALAYGHPALGLNIAPKWSEIANNTSDPQMQSLAKEAQATAGLTSP